VSNSNPLQKIALILSPLDLRIHNDGNRSHFWEHANCFTLDSICHGNGEWFYDRSRANGLDTKYQPNITYTQDKRYGSRWPDKRNYFNVSSTTQYHGSEQCPYALTPYHVVVQTKYNDMIGEFYMRCIQGLNQLMQDYPPQSEKDLQLYLHFFEHGKQNVFHGHRLFLGGLPYNGKVDTFVSLVEDDSCQCFEKLVFCGYNEGEKLNDGNITNATKTFIPAPSILSNSTSLMKLRQDLLAQYATKDHMLDHKIHQHRREILLQKGVREEKIGNVDEWKIIGLTDRKYRRIWLDLDDAMKTCEEFLLHKVMCIKLNVEEAESFEEQLLMHASLDVLIGIHGSQFTNGIFLPRHGFILELLPWIPNYSHGYTWAARTQGPTPMGTVFINSDLHHLGYCLSRDSVPLCEHVDKADEVLDEACLTNKSSDVSKQFVWDVRDFNVDVGVVSKFISSFLLQNSTNCDDMQKRGKEKKFILYNVFCSHANESEYSAEHYYQERCEF